MSDMVKRVGRAIWLKLGSAELDECEEAARAAIEAMRDFNAEDFTLSEATGIRRLIDEALEQHKDC